jgi:anti-sigma regulatory factor (Ser/Thr protein kinase)
MQRRCARNLAELSEIVAMTDRFYSEHGIDPGKRHVVDLCIEELFVNMVTYDTETDARILIELAPHGTGVKVSLTDYDVDRFDPRRAPSVDVDTPLEQREPGGLGLFLVLKMVDSINYEYQDRVSKITFVAGGT